MSDFTGESLMVLAGRSIPELVATGRDAIARAGSFADVREIVTKADVMRAYSTSIRAGTLAINAATEIKLRAERRMGQELAAAELDKGGRPKTGSAVLPVSAAAAPSLEEIGISKAESSRYQRLAAIPEDEFDAKVDAYNEARERLTTAGVLGGAINHRATGRARMSGTRRKCTSSPCGRFLAAASTSIRRHQRLPIARLARRCSIPTPITGWITPGAGGCS